MTAIERVTAAGDAMPADLGGTATTADVTAAVIAAINRENE
jgi:isocitrate/isopropylmalate dehydrogenase